MSKFDVKYSKLSALLLPMCLRGAKMAALANVAVSAVRLLHYEFLNFRKNNLYRLNHNGQVCYLRAVLNDSFDPIERGITITGGNGRTDGIILSQRSECVFTMLPMRADGAVLVYRRGFNGTLVYGFWVGIPGKYQGVINESAVRAVVNTYKLASIRYGINYYSEE